MCKKSVVAGWRAGSYYELDLHGLEQGKNDQAPFFPSVPYAKQFLVDVKTLARQKPGVLDPLCL
jgi:hypothetical protein